MVSGRRLGRLGRNGGHAPNRSLRTPHHPRPPGLGRGGELALRWFRSRGAWASGVGRGPGSGEGSVVVPVPKREPLFDPPIVVDPTTYEALRRFFVELGVVEAPKPRSLLDLLQEEREVFIDKAAAVSATSLLMNPHVVKSRTVVVNKGRAVGRSTVEAEMARLFALKGDENP